MLFLDKLVQLKSWAISNFWNIFSFIGVIATLYLGFFYVPDYVEELGLNKQKLVHQELVEDIQELVFYEQPITLTDIDEIIKGKELVYSMKYKFTSSELLNQIQDDFLHNKFIPLEKRNQLLVSLKNLRSQYHPQKKTPKKNDYMFWLSTGVGILSGLISLLAIASIISKLRADKETEVDIASSINISSVSGDINYKSDTYHTAREYQLMVGEVLGDLNIPTQNRACLADHQCDYLIDVSGVECIVEVKAYSKLLGLGTAKEFVNVVSAVNKPGFLIVKSGLTKRAFDLVHSHNQLTEKAKIYIVTGASKKDVKESIHNAIENFS